MTNIEQYSLFLCLVVFVLLTATFTFMIRKIYKLTVTIIESGIYDERIAKEHRRKKYTFKIFKIIEVLISLAVSLVLIAVFVISLYLNFSEDTYFEDVPTYRVVKSASMEEKHPINTYLDKNGLDNQFATFDMIKVYKAPGEFDLKLYDVVVYEIDDIKVVHRIVGIEEPNEKHPGERLFTLQGDAMARPDNDPVKYSQIEAIYRGEKIPFVGSFVAFMQSPAGWLCILLAFFSMIASSFVDKRLEKQKRLRLEEMGEVLPLYDWDH